MVFDLELPANCPKADVNEFDGTAYRVVRDNPPTKNDLLTYLELGLLPAADACKRASISLFSTRAQAQHRLDVSPHLGNFVASVSLRSADSLSPPFPLALPVPLRRTCLAPPG